MLKQINNGRSMRQKAEELNGSIGRLGLRPNILVVLCFRILFVELLEQEKAGEQSGREFSQGNYVRLNCFKKLIK